MQKIATIENGSVPVYETNTGEKIVYGSELYKGLEIEVSYSEWICSKLDECEAVENEDYYVFVKRPASSVRGIPRLEHLIKFDVAKRIIKFENSKKGGPLA